MSKIEQNRALKRRAILGAAQQTFLAQGYTQASMDNIAALANVTKQTVYRYYPSKIELFKETLIAMREHSNFDFSALQDSDTREALCRFAEDFIRAHTSADHLATYKLLVAECDKAPELVGTFFALGPDETDRELTRFFQERLAIENPQKHIQLWCAMLLSQRSASLLGAPAPTASEISEQARAATALLLEGIGVKH